MEKTEHLEDTALGVNKYDRGEKLAYDGLDTMLAVFWLKYNNTLC